MHGGRIFAGSPPDVNQRAAACGAEVFRRDPSPCHYSASPYIEEPGHGNDAAARRPVQVGLTELRVQVCLGGGVELPVQATMNVSVDPSQVASYEDIVFGVSHPEGHSVAFCAPRTTFRSASRRALAASRRDIQVALRQTKRAFGSKAFLFDLLGCDEKGIDQSDSIFEVWFVDETGFDLCLDTLKRFGFARSDRAPTRFCLRPNPRGTCSEQRNGASHAATKQEPYAKATNVCIAPVTKAQVAPLIGQTSQHVNHYGRREARCIHDHLASRAQSLWPSCLFHVGKERVLVLHGRDCMGRFPHAFDEACRPGLREVRGRRKVGQLVQACSDRQVSRARASEDAGTASPTIAFQNILAFIGDYAVPTGVSAQ